MKPWWRWRLFCLGLELHFEAAWPFSALGGWLVQHAPLGEWFGDAADCSGDTGEEPF